MNLDNQQKEDLRHATLAALAVRAPAALSTRQLARAVKRDLDFLFEESDAAAALALLEGLKLAESAVDDLGTTTYWRATAAGVLKHERA
jgi:hypothetical protein